MSRWPEPDAGAKRVNSNDRPTNVHQILSFSAERRTSRNLFGALVLVLVGLAEMLFLKSSRVPGWFAALVGAVLAMWEYWWPHDAGKPLLVLSPQGILLRIGAIKEVQIPWDEVRGVGSVDITTENPELFFPWRTRHRNVTVVEVSQRFHERNILSGAPVLRGPGWEQTHFIPKDDAVQVALHHGWMLVAPEVMRAEIEARWQAFKGQPQTQMAAGASDASTYRTRASPAVQLALIVIGVLGFAVAAVDGFGVVDKLKRDARQQAIEERDRQRAKTMDQLERVREQHRESREQMKKMFDGFDKWPQ